MKQDNTPHKKCCGEETASPERKCVGMLITVNKEHKNMVENCIDKTGIHRSRHQLLVLIACNKTAPSQKELAEKMNVSPAAVAVNLKKLEKSGYIERSTAETDNRYNEIRISDKGRKLLAETRYKFDELDRAVFNGFSSEDMEKFSDYMKKILQNIRDIEAATDADKQKG